MAKWEPRFKGVTRSGEKYGKSKYLVGKFVHFEDIPPEVEKYVHYGAGESRSEDQNCTSSDHSCYQTIENEEELRKIQQEYGCFPITHLVHDTETKHVANILKNERIEPGEDRKNFEGVGSYRFSWWGLGFDENENEKLQKYRQKMEEAIGEPPEGQRIELLSSKPFSGVGESIYGPCRFSLPVDELFKCYEKSVGELSEKRILCTEVYKCEVMHTVLVHPKCMDDKFQHLQTLDEYMEEQKKQKNPVVTKDDGQLIWHPQSTSVRHPDYNRTKSSWKRWDHLTFAFLIPEEGDIPKREEKEDIPEENDIPGREDSDHKPCAPETVTPPPSDQRLRSVRPTSPAPTALCDGINISFKLLIDKLQILKVNQRWEERDTNLKNVIALLQKVSEQKSTDEFKIFIVRFWDIIQDNLSVRNLKVVCDQCAYIQNLIKIIEEKYGPNFSEEMPQHEEKLRTSIAKVWKVIETKLTEEELIADAKQSGSTAGYRLHDGINELTEVLKHTSKFTMDFFPEEFPGYCQNILRSQQSVAVEQSVNHYLSEHMLENLWETIPLLTNRHKDIVQKNLRKLSPEQVKEEEDKIKESLLQFWDIIQDNLSQGNLSEMVDQCKNMKKLVRLIRENFGEIFPEELPKHEEKLLMEAIVKVWEIIKTNLIAYDKQANEEEKEAKASADDFISVIEGVLKEMKELPPGESLAYYQIVNRCYFYQISKDVLVNFWGIVQDNLTEESDISAISDRCVHFQKLIKIIRENFGEIPEHENKLRESIDKIWDIIEKKQADGIYDPESVKRVSELFIEMLPPEEFPEYYKKIQAVQDIIECQGNTYQICARQIFEDIWNKLWDRIETNVQKQENKLKLFITNFWNIIQNNRYEKWFLLRKQCDDIQRLMKLIWKNFGKISEHKEKLSENIRKIWHIIEKKQEQLGADGIRYPESVVIKCISELFIETLSPEEFPEYYQKLQTVQDIIEHHGSRFGISVSDFQSTFENVRNKLWDRIETSLQKQENKLKPFVTNFWNIIQNNRYEKWFLLEKQCDDIKRLVKLIRENFGKIPPEYEEKLSENIRKIWHIIEKKQKNKKQLGANDIPCLGYLVNHLSELFIETLSPEEFPEYYQKIQAVQDIIEDYGTRIFYFRSTFEDAWKKLWDSIETNLQKQEKLKPFVTNFWNIIQNNRYEKRFLLEKQCDDIKRLMKLIRENFGKIPPEYEEKLSENIRKIWHIICTIKLRYDNLEKEGYRHGSNPGYGLVDGITYLGRLIERVLELIRDTLPPEDLLDYAENIKLCVGAVSNLSHWMYKYLPKYKKKFYQDIIHAVEKFCEEIEKNLTEVDPFHVIKKQCDHIEKLIELIAFVDHYSGDGSHKYHSTMVKVWKIIKTKVRKEHLIAEGRQRNKDKNGSDALVDGLDALGDTFEHISELTRMYKGKNDYLDSVSSFTDLSEFLWDVFICSKDLGKRIDIMDIYLACLKKPSAETEEKLATEDSQMSTLEDGIRVVGDVVKTISELGGNTMSPEELLRYNQNIWQARKAVRSCTFSMENDCKSEFDKMAKEAVDRLWNTIQGKGAIKKMWEIITSKQSELVAEGKQENEDHTTLADDIDALGDAVERISKRIIQKPIKDTLPPEEFEEFCQNIQRIVQAVRDNPDLKKPFKDRYDQMSKTVLDNLWNKISKKILDDDDDDDDNDDDDGDDDDDDEGHLRALQMAVERVAEPIMKVMPPEKLLVYCQDIHRFEQAVKDVHAVNEDCKKAFSDMANKVVVKIWNIIAKNFSEGNYLYEIRDHCRHIDIIIDDLKNSKISTGELETLQEHEQKIQSAIKFLKEGLQGNKDHLFQNFIDALHSVSECISKLTKIDSGAVQENCQNITQSLLAVKDISYNPRWIKPCKPDFYQKFNAIVDKFWSIIEGNLKKENYLSEISDQCYHMKKLMELIRKNFGEIFPEELQKHEEKFQLCISKAWEVIGYKQTEAKLKLEVRQINRFKTHDQGLENGIRDLRDVFEHVSELTIKWFPEMFPIYCHSILQSQQSTISEQSSDHYKRHLEEMSKHIWKKLVETIPLLANKHKDAIQTNSEKESEKKINEQEDEIRTAVLKFWDIIEINISMGRLARMRDQCNNIRELVGLIRENFGEIFVKKYDRELRKSIEKLWLFLETKQTKENLVADARQGNTQKSNDQALEDGIKDLRDAFEHVSELTMKWFPEELPVLLQNILKSQQSAISDQKQPSDRYERHLDEMSNHMWKKLVESIRLLADGHEKIRAALLKFWTIVEINVSVGKLSRMSDQCNSIRQLIELIRENFEGILPTEHKQELRKSIKKIWSIIKIKQQAKENLVADGRQGNQNRKYDEALTDGITSLFVVIESVLKLSIKYFPEEFSANTQLIEQSPLTTEAEQFHNNDDVAPQKHCFYQITKDVLGKFWDIIISNLSEAENLIHVRNQCCHIEKLIELIWKHSKSISPEDFLLEHERKLREFVAKVWGIIETKQTTLKSSADDINTLGDVIERISKLITNTLPVEELQGYCQNIQRSLEAVRNIQSDNQLVSTSKKDVLSKLNKLLAEYEKEIDPSRSKQKCKRDSMDESETAEKRQCKSSADSETAEKRQRKSSADSETSQKRQCKSPTDSKTSQKRQRKSPTDSEMSQKRQRKSPTRQ